MKIFSSPVLRFAAERHAALVPSAVRGAGMSYVHAVNPLSVLHKGARLHRKKAGNMYKLTERAQ